MHYKIPEPINTDMGKRIAKAVDGKELKTELIYALEVAFLNIEILTKEIEELKSNLKGADK